MPLLDQRLWLRATVIATVFLMCLPTLGVAALLVSHPTERIQTLDESAVLVFDPLARSQTTLIRWRFEGATRPFAVILPVPDQAELKVGLKSTFDAFQRRLHPVGRVRRDIQLDFKSWVGSCVVPEVGDVAPKQSTVKTPTLTLTASPVNETPMNHDWFLRNGFTISPAQASWLREIKQLGWRAVAVRFVPPADVQPSDVHTSPVVAITHRSTEAVYPAYIPKFSIKTAPGADVPLEIAVLSEWPVEMTGRETDTPFLSEPLTGKSLARIAKTARGLDWTFRRDGILTAYRLNSRRNARRLTFTRSSAIPAVRPPVTPRVRPVLIPVPVEAVLIISGIVIWAWIGSRRRGRRTRGIR